jgi:hypothetical protein
MKLPSHVGNAAHILTHANLLEMALDGAWGALSLCIVAREVCTDPAKIKAVEALKRDVTRVQGQVSELRHRIRL